MSNQSNFKNIINKYVKLIQDKMNTDEMKFLKKFHQDEYQTVMEEFIPEFYKEYPSLFNMIIKGNDLSMLDLFLNKLDDIDQGKNTLDAVRQDLGKILHNKYVANNDYNN
jgi:hypothetical protein